MRLEGYPGAPIDKDHFTLAEGTWTFVDRLNPDRKPLRLKIRRKSSGDGYVLAGVKEEAAEITLEDGFLEIWHKGKLVERPLKLRGAVGDTWRGGRGRCTAYGYDELDVLGKTRRALVVAIERDGERDYYWFVADIGWARIRTERSGRVIRDAVLHELTRP